MRRLATYIVLAVVLSASALCTAIVVDTINAQEPKPVPSKSLKIPCRAQYAPLTPFELVGMDECGHIWKLILPRSMRPHPSNPESEDIKYMGQNDTDEPICVYWDLESGQFIKFECPEPGQVTGEIELEPGELR